MEILHELFGLSGKVAIVTGAGSGIGAATAQVLAGAGAALILADMNEGTAAEVAADITARGGIASTYRTDISSEAEIKALIAHARDQAGGIDIFVNNAACVLKTEFLETSAEAWDRMQATNLRGTFLCCREAIRQMVGQGRGGRIINVSSIASVHPTVVGNGPYAASKGGVNALTRHLAMEYAAQAITVNAVLPGPTETGALASATADGFVLRGPSLSPERRLTGRKSKPVEIAATILFFASPASGQVTGQLLAVDGGFLVS